MVRFFENIFFDETKEYTFVRRFYAVVGFCFLTGIVLSYAWFGIEKLVGLLLN